MPESAGRPMAATRPVRDAYGVKRWSARVPIVVVAGAIALTACGSADRPPARVLGVEYTRPTTATTARAATSSSEEAAMPPGAPAVTTTTASAPRPSTAHASATAPATTTTEAPDPDAESLAPGVYVERDDSGGYFTVGSGGPDAGHAMQLDRAARRLAFQILATPQPDGTAGLEATLTNTSGRLIRFPGGATILVRMTHDGEPMDDHVLRDATILEIPPGATIQVRGAMPLAGDGLYAYSAATTIELV